jgi:hypothetical protein
MHVVVGWRGPLSHNRRACGGVAKAAIWRWQGRFMQPALISLLRERIPQLAPEMAERVVALTLATPPFGRSAATAVGRLSLGL